MELRPYQLDLYQRTREAFRRYDRVFMQLPTGGGKTAIVAEMIKSASERGWNTWAIVPRNELLKQMSDTLLSVGVKHGIISPGRYESAAFDVHVASKDTIVSRLKRGDIRKPPQFAIIDEAHIALDGYCSIFDQFRFPNCPRYELGGVPAPNKLLGISATPERLDGRGLSELYETLVLGPTIPELIEQGYLSDCEYFCPPIQGLDKVHRKGTEYDEAELDELLKARKVYGSAIEHYRRHADGKPALVFCRSVKAAAETAQRFCDAGYRFENIDGTMTDTRRSALISGLKSGELDGLTSCELITYGLDVPRVECVIMLRPTLSRTLYMQMLGRGLRPWIGKPHLIVLDHVGNLQEHKHPFTPHVWNFDGREKRKRNRDESVIARLCPALDFLYCSRPSCAWCQHAPEGKDPRRKLEEINADLVLAKKPVEIKKPSEEEIVGQMTVQRAATTYHAEESKNPGVITALQSGAIGELLEEARRTGRQPMWVYYRLNQNRYSVNVTLVNEIGRQCGYDPKWAGHRIDDIHARMDRERNRKTA